MIPDRIETGTYMIAVAACGGRVLLKNCVPEHVRALADKLQHCGLVIEEGQDDMLLVYCPDDGGLSRCALESIDITTRPYSGFPTDLQAQFMALMTLAEGTSVIHETIFENRFMHVSELARLGANIYIEGKTAMVEGVDKLSGATVMATDLRASAGLVIAALVADGETTIERIYHLDRGYDQMEEKLKALGADIERVTG